MLKIRNIVKSFGSKEVLHGIDLTIEKGEIIGLVGKNGAGKTTLFHCLLNFLDFDGTIELDEKPITAEAYNKIGYLPEERSLMPKMTVQEQIIYLASLKGMSQKDIKTALPLWMNRLEVKGKATDKIKSLSKGMNCTPKVRHKI